MKLRSIDFGEFAFRENLIFIFGGCVFLFDFFTIRYFSKNKDKVMTLIAATQSNRALIHRREMSITRLSTNELSRAKRT